MATWVFVFCLSVALLCVGRTTPADTKGTVNQLDAKLNAIERSLDVLKQSAKLKGNSLKRVLDGLQRSVQERGDFLKETEQEMKLSETNLLHRIGELEKNLLDNMENNSCQNTMRPHFRRLHSDTDKILKLQDEFVKATNISKSCKSISNKESGQYTIELPNKETIPVFCEQVAFGGGWIVFQHRFDGSVNFFRTWTEYRTGFGDLGGEFWLGLEPLHLLTSSRKHELVVEVKDHFGNYAYANYDLFLIRGDVEMYSLKIGRYNGTAGDSLRDAEGLSFSTKDKDNDPLRINCAAERQGAWWFNECGYSNLNGPYKNSTESLSAMRWFFYNNDNRAMAYTRMMIREID